MSSDDSTFLYDRELLNQIDFSKTKSKFSPELTPQNPGNGLELRPLCSTDFDRGFIELLKHHVNFGEVTKEDFLERFYSMRDRKGTYFVTVLADKEKDLLIGSASLVVEEKFIFDLCKRGMIEDVVVRREYRGKQFGKLLIGTLVELGNLLNLHYITLDCNDTNKPFYQKFGFNEDENFMIQWYKPKP